MPKLAAIILAAGLGTRMRSASPKVLHEVAGDPMLFYPLRAADAVGADSIITVLGHQATEVTQAIEQRGPKTKATFCFAEQKKPLGTADAVKVTEAMLKSFSGDVLILCGDTPFISKKSLAAFLRFHRRGKNDLSVMTALLENPSSYGRIIRDNSDNVVGIVEEMDATAAEKQICEINTGLYLVSKKLLFSNLQKIKKNSRKKEYYLTDLIGLLNANKKKVGGWCLADAREALGVNSRAELVLANRWMQERLQARWMKEGVTFVNPLATQIDYQVRLQRDVTIGSGCQLRGQTIIKTGTVIDTGAVVTDSTVGPHCMIKPYSVVEDSQIEAECQIGPFAHIRPQSHVGVRAKVGNFVELKKTRLGKGAKANHLSYLGDAMIGAESNIGAGTITCNYDGYKKYPTRIGPRSFIGSDTQLVAPVTLGADAWIGAGATITKNVPAGALAVSRPEQITVPGWAEKKRRKEAKGKRS